MAARWVEEGDLDRKSPPLPGLQQFLDIGCYDGDGMMPSGALGSEGHASGAFVLEDREESSRLDFDVSHGPSGVIFEAK